MRLPFPCPIWEKIFLPATAAGGLHARWKRYTKKSQEAFRYLAISLVGEDIRRKKNLSTEANRNGRPDPRPGDCAESSTSSSTRLKCTNSKIEACFDDHRPAMQSFRTMRIVSYEHLAELLN